MLGPNDLVLCSGTLLQASFQQLLAAAGAGDFQGITLWPHCYQQAHAQGLSDADLRAMLSDSGLVVADLDPLLTWLPAEAELARKHAVVGVSEEHEFYAIAEALGARSLNVAQGFGQTVDLDAAAEALAGVCDRAAEHGLLITLEFLPWSGISDAATAHAIVDRTGRENATVMLDTWHHFRGPCDQAQLRAIPGHRIGSVQINDAPKEAPDDLVEESMQARLLPGEGDAPVIEVLQILDEIGSTAPIGVEVFSKQLNALPPEEVGRRSGAAARRVLEAARRGGRIRER
jgi:sugar phosphate isomerase/epimerase